MKKLLALLILGGIVSCAQSPNQTAKLSLAFPLEHLDTNVHACDDFFQYTSGGWREANPIPETEVRWGEFNKLRETNKQRLKDLFNEVAAGSYSKGSDEQLIGDLVASGMEIGRASCRERV